MFRCFTCSSSVSTIEFKQVNVDVDVINIVPVFLWLSWNMFHIFS